MARLMNGAAYVVMVCSTAYLAFILVCAFRELLEREAFRAAAVAATGALVLGAALVHEFFIWTRP